MRQTMIYNICNNIIKGKQQDLSVFLDINKSRISSVIEELNQSTTDFLTTLLLTNGNKHLLLQLSKLFIIDHKALLIPYPQNGYNLGEVSWPKKTIITTNIPCIREASYTARYLEKFKFENIEVFTSVIVAKRMLRHKRLLSIFPNGVPTAIVKGLSLHSGKKVELFITNNLNRYEAALEILNETESHLAFKLIDIRKISQALSLIKQTGYLSNGGGKNILENTTTLYFIKEAKFKRIEIIFSGIHDEILRKHLSN